jgi:hypothetical protein
MTDPNPNKGKCLCGTCGQLVPVGRTAYSDDGFGKRTAVWRRPKVHKHEGVRCPGSDGDALRPPGSSMTWLPGD